MPQKGQILKQRYQLQQKLGQNPCRQTWLGMDLTSQSAEAVIIKLLAVNPEINWDNIKLFEREAQVLQLLNHPRIPKYRDYFALERQPGERLPWFALVQNYIWGKSLQQLIDEGKRFSQEDVIYIATEVLAILVCIHEFNPPIIHRDIKPSNLIWGEDGRIYLIDFGSVQDQAALVGATFTVVGTYGYVPMEQFGGKAVPASDLYSLGASLIHLITGVLPADLPAHDSSFEFTDKVNLEPDLVAWIKKLTEPTLAARFNTARQAIQALENRDNLSLLTTNSQPKDSQIKFSKSPLCLEIKIPSEQVNILHLVGLLTFILFEINLLFGAIYSAHALWQVKVGVFSIGILFLSWMLIRILLLRFSYNYLVLSSDRFEIGWKLFGWCYRKRRERIGEISEIIEEEASKQKPKFRRGLTIVSDSQKYTTNSMSKIERIWLMQEIRDWLKSINRN